MPRRGATPPWHKYVYYHLLLGGGGAKALRPLPLSQQRRYSAEDRTSWANHPTPLGPGPLLSLAFLLARFLRATPAGVGQGCVRSPRRPHAPHAHLRGPPHLRRHHKVPASGVRSELGCAPGRVGAAPPPCPAPRPPAPPGARGAELKGVRERGRSSPWRPHPRRPFLFLLRRRRGRLTCRGPLVRSPSPLLAAPPTEPLLLPRPQPLSPQTFRQDGGPGAGLPRPHVTAFPALSANGK